MLLLHHASAGVSAPQRVERGGSMEMRDERLAVLRRRLEDERADLQAQIDSLDAASRTDQGDDGDSSNISDEATDLVIRERNLVVRNNTQDLLRRVQAALTRLESGSYGTCARCGAEIPTERLEVLPHATMCVSCQAKAET